VDRCSHDRINADFESLRHILNAAARASAFQVSV